MSAHSASSTLAQVLHSGNRTCGKNICITDGDKIVGKNLKLEGCDSITVKTPTLVLKTERRIVVGSLLIQNNSATEPTLTVSNLSAASESLALDIKGNVEVEGDTILTGSVSVIAPPAKALGVPKKFTVLADTQMTGNLELDGVANMGPTTVNGDASVSGNLVVGDPLVIPAASLTVNGDASVSGNLTAGNPDQPTSGLTVYGGADVVGSLEVHGNSFFSGNAILSGDANVKGIFTVGNNSGMSSGNLDVYGNAAISERMIVYGGLVVGPVPAPDKGLTVNGDIVSSGSIGINNGAFINGLTTLSYSQSSYPPAVQPGTTLQTAGNVEINGDLTVTGQIINPTTSVSAAAGLSDPEKSNIDKIGWSDYTLWDKFTLPRRGRYNVDCEVSFWSSTTAYSSIRLVSNLRGVILNGRLIRGENTSRMIGSIEAENLDEIFTVQYYSSEIRLNGLGDMALLSEIGAVLGHVSFTLA